MNGFLRHRAAAFPARGGADRKRRRKFNLALDLLGPSPRSRHVREKSGATSSRAGAVRIAARSARCGAGGIASDSVAARKRNDAVDCCARSRDRDGSGRCVSDECCDIRTQWMGGSCGARGAAEVLYRRLEDGLRGNVERVTTWRFRAGAARRRRCGDVRVARSVSRARIAATASIERASLPNLRCARVRMRRAGVPGMLRRNQRRRDRQRLAMHVVDLFVDAIFAFSRGNACCAKAACSSIETRNAEARAVAAATSGAIDASRSVPSRRACACSR